MLTIFLVDDFQTSFFGYSLSLALTEIRWIYSANAIGRYKDFACLIDEPNFFPDTLSFKFVDGFFKYFYHRTRTLE